MQQNHEESAEISVPHTLHNPDDGTSQLPSEKNSPDHSLGVPVHSMPGTWLILLVCVIVATLGLGTSYYLVHRQRLAEDSQLERETTSAVDAPPLIDVAKVQLSSASYVITLPGESRAWFESTVFGRVNGYLKKWHVDIGDHVKEGQVLATIETPELDGQLAAAEAKVKAYQAQVKLAQANLHYTDMTYARYKDAPKGVVSDVERDQKDADYQTSTSRLNAAQADLGSAQAEADRLRVMMAFQKVVAPFDGIITERRVDIGDLVTAGSTASTSPLFKISQSDQIRVYVDVPQATAPEIHDGDKAEIHIKEFPKRTFIGHVARNSKSINLGSRTLRMEVDVPNPDGAILPGMYVMVNFETGKRQPKLQIPASAMNFRSGGPKVAVVDKNSRITFQSVTIERDLGSVIEIASGLSPDDRVALNISNQIAQGDEVKAIEVDDTGKPLQTAFNGTQAPIMAASVR